MLTVHCDRVDELLLRREGLSAGRRYRPFRTVLPDTALRGLVGRAGAPGGGLGAQQQQER